MPLYMVFNIFSALNNCAFIYYKGNNGKKQYNYKLLNHENIYSGRTKQAKGPHVARGPPI